MILNPWKEIRRQRGELEERKNKIDALRRYGRDMQEEVYRLLNRADKLNIGLQDIIAEERPTSNATVKRMAKIAREALKK
jgi:uncharacterized coiled-coil DUF342 family protein